MGRRGSVRRSSTVTILDFSHLVDPSRRPSLSPRTCELLKEGCRKTEAEVDAALQAIQRRLHADKSPSTTTGQQLQATGDPWGGSSGGDDDPDDSDLLAMSRNPNTRIAMRLATAQVKFSPTENRWIPLTAGADGRIRVDMAALHRNSAARLLRHCDDNRCLTPREVDRVCKTREKLHRPHSAPNFLKKNVSAEALRAMRPEVLQQEREKQALRRNKRADAVAARHRSVVEDVRTRTLSAERERQLLHQQAADRAASRVKRPAALHNKDRVIMVLKWVAAEGFLSFVQKQLCRQRLERLEVLWALAVRHVRVNRFLRRCGRRLWAAKVVREIMTRIPVGYRARLFFYKQTKAVRRVQRAWRKFNICIKTVVGTLLRGVCKKQEQYLLEQMFSMCPASGDTIVRDNSLLRGESSEVRKSTRQWTKMSLARRKSIAAGAAAAAVRQRQSSPGGPWPAPVPRPVSAKQVKLNQEFDEMMVRAFAMRLREQVSAHSFRRDVVARVIRRELIERIYEYRSTYGGTTNSVLATAVSQQRASPMVRRLADVVTNSEENLPQRHLLVAGNSVATLLALWTVPVPARLRSEDVAELILCMHSECGTSPAKPEAAQHFFRGCAPWRLRAVAGVVAGRRTIREGLLDRWAVRRGEQRQVLCERNAEDKKDVALSLTRPSTVEVSKDREGADSRLRGWKLNDQSGLDKLQWPLSAPGMSFSKPRPTSAPVGLSRGGEESHSSSINDVSTTAEHGDFTICYSTHNSTIKTPKAVVTDLEIVGDPRLQLHLVGLDALDSPEIRIHDTAEDLSSTQGAVNTAHASAARPAWR